jgi:hypothetical protein
MTADLERQAQTYDAVRADLIARHGGEAAFSPVSLAIVHDITLLLADDNADPLERGKVASALMAFLPPGVKPAVNKDVDPRLGRLYDDELVLLDKLVAQIEQADDPHCDEPSEDCPSLPRHHYSHWHDEVSEAVLNHRAVARLRMESETADRAIAYWIAQFKRLEEAGVVTRDAGGEFVPLYPPRPAPPAV